MGIVDILQCKNEIYANAEPVNLSPLLFLSLKMKEETKSQISRN